MERIHESLLSGSERRVLSWLVKRLPLAVKPDHLTAFGVLGAGIVFLGYALCYWSPGFLWLATVGVILHWFGDSLDGTLARHRGSERPRYGYFLDQTVDVIGNLIIGAGIGISPYVHMSVALFALAGYHALSIYSFVRAAISSEFHVSLLNSGPTEIRLLIIMMNTLILTFGAPPFAFFGAVITWCDIAMMLLAIGFFCAFGYLVAVYARELGREEPPR